MPVKCVDASALASILFSEAERDNIVGRLSGATLVAPALLSFELAQVCWLKSRREPERAAELREAFRLRDRIAVDEVAVEHDEALELALRTGLTAYDATYLWVAYYVGAKLITLDRQLQRVWSATPARDPAP